MAHLGPGHQTAAGDGLQVIAGIAHGDHGIGLAPDQQSGRSDLAQQWPGLLQHGLRQTVEHGLTRTWRQNQIVVARGHGIAERLGLGIGRFQVHAQQRLGQHMAHQAQRGGHGHGLAVFETKTGKTIRGHQHQFVGALGELGRKGPGDAPAHGVAHQAGTGQAQVVQQGDQQLQAALVAVIMRRVGRAQAAAGQVDAHHAVRGGQTLGPSVPSLQTRTKAVQQDHRWGIRWGTRCGIKWGTLGGFLRSLLLGTGRAAVTHMQLPRTHLAQVGGGREVTGLQRGARHIGCPQPKGQQRQSGQRQHKPGPLHAGQAARVHAAQAARVKSAMARWRT